MGWPRGQDKSVASTGRIGQPHRCIRGHRCFSSDSRAGQLCLCGFLLVNFPGTPLPFLEKERRAASTSLGLCEGEV
jgi:hypothetical protein